MKYKVEWTINAVQHLISLTGIDYTVGTTRPLGDVELVHIVGYFHETVSMRWSLSEGAHDSPRSPRSAW